MKNLLMCLAMLAAGCGGDEFQDQLFGAGGDGSGGETQATNTGGQTTSTGGAGVVGTGGLPGETGGAPADDSGAPGGSTNSGTGGGGSPGTGGISAGTGGEATGGAVSTGGVAATGGTTGCTLVTHDNGLGQTWQDCVPLGTHDQAQALKACVASGAGMCLALNGCGAIYWEIRGYTTDGSQVIGFWMYGGPSAGYVNAAACGAPPCSPDACSKQWN